MNYEKRIETFREGMISPKNTNQEDKKLDFVNTESNPGEKVIQIITNLENWKFEYNPNTPWGANTISSGFKHGVDAMFLGYHGDWADFESFVYWSGTYSEMNQDNIQIPRGNLVDAYISFDYLLEFGFNTNNIIMYLNINDKTVYSKGMLDIANSGKNIWHSTGKVPLYLWENQTNIFNTIPLNDQSINVTLGLKLLGTSTKYS